MINLGDFAAEKFGENFSKKLDTLIAYGMNGVYINPYGKDGTYYTTNMNKSGDRLEKALEAATKKECRDMSISTLTKQWRLAPMARTATIIL